MMMMQLETSLRFMLNLVFPLPKLKCGNNYSGLQQFGNNIR